MDGDLKRYLNAIVALLSLNIGFLATLMWVSAETVSPMFLIIPPAIGAMIFGGGVWLLTGALSQ
jgi:hypothetical protein